MGIAIFGLISSAALIASSAVITYVPETGRRAISTLKSFQKEFADTEEINKEQANQWFDTFVSDSKEIASILSFDLEVEFETSCKEVMAEFISEISPELSPEQLVKLKTIFGQE